MLGTEERSQQHYITSDMIRLFLRRLFDKHQDMIIDMKRESHNQTRISRSQNTDVVTFLVFERCTRWLGEIIAKSGLMKDVESRPPSSATSFDRTIRTSCLTQQGSLHRLGHQFLRSNHPPRPPVSIKPSTSPASCALYALSWWTHHKRQPTITAMVSGMVIAQ